MSDPAAPPPTPTGRGVDVVVERVIRAPRSRLAAFAADMGNAPRWYRNIKTVEWQSAPSSAVGARAAFTADFVGKRLSYTYEIRRHTPGESLMMSTDEGPFPMETIYEWSDAGPGRTRMRLTNRGYPSGFKTMLMPIMALAMRRAMTQDLKKLDRVIARLR